MKNKSYIGISLIVLVFGIWVVKELPNRLKPKLETIADAPKFELTNQNGKKITNADYKGKVYVLEFFFTSCPSICPVMNQNMKKIEKEFAMKPDFGIVSISIDPNHDTPEVLKQHAKFLGVTSQNWNFLTGDEDYIYNIANKGFNIFAGKNAKVNGGFEHSGLFALIDKEGKIRCRKDENGNAIMYYDGLEPKGIKEITEDIEILLNE